MSAPLRVVVADDQALVRTGFRLILMADGIDVVAEPANGEEAVEAVLRTRPDIVLMDIRMPELDGAGSSSLPSPAISWLAMAGGTEGTRVPGPEHMDAGVHRAHCTLAEHRGAADRAVEKGATPTK